MSRRLSGNKFRHYTRQSLIWHVFSFSSFSFFFKYFQCSHLLEIKNTWKNEAKKRAKIKAAKFIGPIGWTVRRHGEQTKEIDLDRLPYSSRHLYSSRPTPSVFDFVSSFLLGKLKGSLDHLDRSEAYPIGTCSVGRGRIVASARKAPRSLVDRLLCSNETPSAAPRWTRTLNPFLSNRWGEDTGGSSISSLRFISTDRWEAF